MRAGFPTDDPWADRLEELDAAAYDDLLRGVGTYAWAPGLAFDYSNLGYTIATCWPGASDSRDDDDRSRSSSDIFEPWFWSHHRPWRWTNRPTTRWR